MAKSVALLCGIVVGLMAAEPVMTGSFVLDRTDARVSDAAVAVAGTFSLREVLENPGFESGTLEPWISTAWTVDTTFPHAGVYCASVVGNFCVEQTFRPVPVQLIQQVKFWARQPDQPAAQAYAFIYDDGTIGEFVHYPIPHWQEYDVTMRLNRSKSLRGFRLWGYSGGGPDPDSTYVDDVSITRQFDVNVQSVTGLAPGETVPVGTPVALGATVANNGTLVESLYVWARIELDPGVSEFQDSVWLGLDPGQQNVVQFDTWTAQPEQMHRFQVTVDPQDTIWHYFWVGTPSAAEEPRTARSVRLVTPGIGRAFAWDVHGAEVLRIYEASGRLVCCRRGRDKLQWPGTDLSGATVPAGVYTARIGDRTFRLVVPVR